MPLGAATERLKLPLGTSVVMVNFTVTLELQAEALSSSVKSQHSLEHPATYERRAAPLGFSIMMSLSFTDLIIWVPTFLTQTVMVPEVSPVA